MMKKTRRKQEMEPEEVPPKRLAVSHEGKILEIGTPKRFIRLLVFKKIVSIDEDQYLVAFPDKINELKMMTLKKKEQPCHPASEPGACVFRVVYTTFSPGEGGSGSAGAGVAAAAAGSGCGHASSGGDAASAGHMNTRMNVMAEVEQPGAQEAEARRQRSIQRRAQPPPARGRRLGAAPRGHVVLEAYRSPDARPSAG
eukprot:3560358-Prymnesium_polylepis.4